MERKKDVFDLMIKKTIDSMVDNMLESIVRFFTTPKPSKKIESLEEVKNLL